MNIIEIFSSACFFVNFQTFDLNLLRVFDAVMAEGSLTRAADRLSITQPAVSNALKRLKESVGEDLLTRTAHGVKPTPFAERIWPEVRTALGRLREAFDPPPFNPQRDATNFRLAMADATAVTLLPALITHIEQTRALVNLRVVPLGTRDPRGLLERDDADVAVGYFPEAVAALVADSSAFPTMHHLRLHDSEYVCVMRRGHPLADTELTLDAYCAAHHLLVTFSGRAHGFVDEALASLGRSRRIMLTVNQFFTAGRVVSQSDLLTVLPASFVGATGYKHHLVERPLPLRLEPIHVEMLWHLRHDQNSAHQWLRNQLMAVERQRDPDPALLAS
jgi:DNA-binding transcriptional LysR family regulator